jgi:hypothetical protein
MSPLSRFFKRNKPAAFTMDEDGTLVLSGRSPKALRIELEGGQVLELTPERFAVIDRDGKARLTAPVSGKK